MSMSVVKKKRIVTTNVVISVAISAETTTMSKRPSENLYVLGLIMLIFIVVISIFGIKLWQYNALAKELISDLNKLGYTHVETSAAIFPPSPVCVFYGSNSPRLLFTAKDSNGKVVSGHICKQILFNNKELIFNKD